MTDQALVPPAEWVAILLEQLRIPHAFDEARQGFVVEIEGIQVDLDFLGEDDDILNIEATLLRDVSRSPSGLAAVAAWSGQLTLAKFGLSDDDRLTVEHEMLVPWLDVAELGAALETVRQVDANYTEQLRRAVGGTVPARLAAARHPVGGLWPEPTLTHSQVVDRVWDHLAAAGVDDGERGEPTIRLDVDGEMVTVEVREDAPVVRIGGVVAFAATDRPEQRAELLELNRQLTFGRLALLGDHVVLVEHDLIADTLDGEELLNAISSVAAVADEWGPRLTATFGGETSTGRTRTSGETGLNLSLWTFGETTHAPSGTSVSEFAIRVGDHVAGYEVEDVLGSGAYGTVYRARDPLLPRSVALKVLRPQVAVDPAARERFRREAIYSARVNHPNLVKVLSAGFSDERPYIVYDYVEGRTLQDVINVGALDVRRTLRIVRQIGGALQALHDQGITHRDVKPANILIWRPGSDLESAVLTDLGVAFSRSDGDLGLTRTGATPGAPLYQPPEALTTHTTAPAVDVYAFAVTVYEMLTGAAPFRDSTSEEELRHRVLTEDPVPVRESRDDVPRDVDVVLARGLAKAPIDRYPDVERFVGDLIAVLGTSARTTPRPTVPPGVAAYEEWRPAEGLADPMFAHVATLAAGLREIVEVEAPVLCERLFRLYLRGAGRAQLSSQIRKRLRSALRQLADDGIVVDNEWGTRSVLDRVIRHADEAVRPRTLGPRAVGEVPPSEMAAVARILVPRGAIEERRRALLAFYGRKRSSATIDEQLAYALANF